jgi:integrase
MFLEQMKAWSDDQKTGNRVTSSTATNRQSTYHKMLAYMQAELIEDFDLFDYDFTVNRSPQERLDKGQWLEDFFLGFRDFLDTIEGLQHSTINQHRTNLVVFLNWRNFKRVKLQIPVPDFFKTKIRPKDRVVALSVEQVEKILQLPNTSSASINTKLALITCWRVNDLVSLRVGDVELSKDGRTYWITRITEKTKKRMSTPVPFALMTRIFKYFGHDPSDPNLESKYLLKFDTPCVSGDPRSRRFVHDVRKALATAFGADATIKTVSFKGEPSYISIPRYSRAAHLLRRSGATYYAAMGMSLETIAALYTGHDDIKTLREFYVDPVTQRASFVKDFAFNETAKALYGYNEIVTGRAGSRDARILESMEGLFDDEINK